MDICFIWCQTATGVIGIRNRSTNEFMMPWNISDNREDMNHFYQTTVNNVVVMGYNTYVSIGCKDLPKRLNYVLTRRLHSNTFKPDLDAVLLDLNKHTQYSKLFIIGGSKIFEMYKDRVQYLYRTIYKKFDIETIKSSNNNELIYMPEIDYSKFELISQTITDSNIFEVYKRHQNLNELIK